MKENGASPLGGAPFLVLAVKAVHVLVDLRLEIVEILCVFVTCIQAPCDLDIFKNLGAIFK
jgi:hypothetical protein